MKVLLKTKCGCEKLMEVDNNHRDILIAILPDIKPYYTENDLTATELHIETRRFMFKGNYKKSTCGNMSCYQISCVKPKCYGSDGCYTNNTPILEEI